ncbi:hypothetical protein D9M69_658350 [compost metagenome]
MRLTVVGLRVLQHRGQRTHTAQTRQPRVVFLGILLQHQSHGHLAGHGVLQGSDRLRPAQRHGRQHVRKEHQIAHGQQRHHIGWQRIGAGQWPGFFVHVAFLHPPLGSRRQMWQ